ncbi:MAG TPA: ParA family protein [bacterium]|jgi:chromosome partitioning protein|nr:ParA family protein [bacterium]
MKALALANNKGGVGKTTAATNLAAQAVRSRLGATILLDLDPQRNAGFGLGIAMDLAGLDEFLAGRVDLTEIIHPHAVNPQRLPDGADSEDFVIEGLYVVAAGPNLQDESDRLSEADFERAVGRLRAGLIAFDEAAAAQGVPVGLVVLDLPPSLGRLTRLGLAVADTVIVPVEPQEMSTTGLDNLIAFIEDVRQTHNPGLDLAGVFISRYRENASQEKVQDILKAKLGQRLFTSVIKNSQPLADAYSAFCPLVWSAPAAAAAQQYRNLAKELFSYMGVR